MGDAAGEVLEVVVPHVVEGLHDGDARQLLLHELAGRRPCVGELLEVPVGLPPVVHGIDDDLAGQSVGRDRSVLAQRQREDHQVGPLGGLPAGHRLRPGGEDLGDQLDLLGITGARDQHVVPGGDGEAGQHSADLAGAEDPEGAMEGGAHAGGNAEGRRRLPGRDRFRARRPRTGAHRMMATGSATPCRCDRDRPLRCLGAPEGDAKGVLGWLRAWVAGRCGAGCGSRVVGRGAPATDLPEQGESSRQPSARPSLRVQRCSHPVDSGRAARGEIGGDHGQVDPARQLPALIARGVLLSLLRAAMSGALVFDDDPPLRPLQIRLPEIGSSMCRPPIGQRLREARTHERQAERGLGRGISTPPHELDRLTEPGRAAPGEVSCRVLQLVDSGERSVPALVPRSGDAYEVVPDRDERIESDTCAELQIGVQAAGPHEVVSGSQGHGVESRAAPSHQ
ncbi:hypothetical protein FM103_04750 [Corynebacterium xerosis]|nr:hypothetical protein FM103_04750 [Corynebacterium xerosis]